MVMNSELVSWLLCALLCVAHMVVFYGFGKLLSHFTDKVLADKEE